MYIDSQLKATTIQLDFEVCKAYYCDDWLWIIDAKNDLYTMQVLEDNTYKLSDIILGDVDCVTGDANSAIAINTQGEVFVWGKGDEYYSIGLGENEEIADPVQIEGISHAKEVVRFNVNTAILTEEGELYVVGGIISSEWSEEKQEFIENTEYITEFRKIKSDSRISQIGEYEGLYTIDEVGTVLAWSGIKMDDGEIVLDSSYSNWNIDKQFSQISFGQTFSIGLDENNKLYYWGVDFVEERKNKSDYTIYSTPKLIEFRKNVENVYASGDVAFLKNGLELYVIPDR